MKRVIISSENVNYDDSIISNLESLILKASQQVANNLQVPIKDYDFTSIDPSYGKPEFYINKPKRSRMIHDHSDRGYYSSKISYSGLGFDGTVHIYFKLVDEPDYWSFDDSFLYSYGIGIELDIDDPHMLEKIVDFATTLITKKHSRF